MSKSPDKTRVAIIGAGMSGLPLAQGLQKIGFQVTVYEKQENLQATFREWTMLAHWGLPTLQSILPEDIVKDIRTAYTDPFHPYTDEKERIQMYNGLSGDLLFQVPTAGRRLSRTRFRRLCSRDLDIRWGHMLNDITLDGSDTGPATIHFEGKESATADVVIGADGANSRVRKWLVGEDLAKPEVSGHPMANGIMMCKTAEQSRITRGDDVVGTLAIMHGYMMLLTVQNIIDPKDPLTWSFHLARIWNDPTIEFTEGPKAIAKLKALTSADPSICERFRSTVLSMDEDKSRFFITQLHHWPTIPWDNENGRVTLVGDAAHALHPSRGQGLNQALSDIEILFKGFSKVKDGLEGVPFTIQGVLDEYEKDVFVRGRKAVLDSLVDTGFVTNLDGFQTRSNHALKGMKE